MSTNTEMTRKMTALVTLVVTLGIGPLALAPTAWSSIITINNMTPMVVNNYSSPYNLTAAGAIDWAFPNRSEKAGGTAIVTYSTTAGKPDGHLVSPYNDYNNDFYFSYADGETNSSGGAASSPGVWPYSYSCVYEYADASFSATINLPANTSGAITVWCGTWSKDGLAVPGTFTATFADTTSATSAMPGDGTGQMIVLNYSTATAQALTLTLTDTGDSGNTGIFALAVAPEPGSAVLLTASLMALLSRTSRKRN